MKKELDLSLVKPVKLKSFLGMKPEIWVPIAYLILILLIVFLVGFLPGILNGRKKVSFVSAVPNTAVYVDDTYAGGTPFDVFISSGSHIASFKKNGIEIDRITFKVSHPVFLTWLFPRFMKVESTAGFDKNSIKQYEAQFIRDVEQYSGVLDYSNRTISYPTLFTDYADTIIASSLSPNLDIFKLAAYYITSVEMLNDAKKASQLLNLNFDFSQIEANYNGFQNTFTSVDIPKSNIIGNSNLDLGLVDIPGYNYGEFNISATEITQTQWAAFLKENSEYEIPEGMSGSLVNISNSAVSNISWKEAVVFCAWASKKTGRTVFLPTEMQWMSVANSLSDNIIKKHTTGFSNLGYPDGLYGGVWEMTSTNFIPLGRIADSTIYDTLNKLQIDTDIVLKGGFYNSESIKSTDIGVSEVDRKSPFVGFRIAWK